MDAALHRIEALPGGGRYSVTFRSTSGAEQSLVAEVSGETVTIASATLPPDWQSDGRAFSQLVQALESIERARSLAHVEAQLADVEGGWDVMIGNVLLAAGVVTCAAHGPMEQHKPGEWSCPESDCGARGLYTG